MKRSEINAAIRDADAFLGERQFYLPPWAHWPPDAWVTRRAAVQQVIERGLGWDVTDFGRGDYRRIGLAGFTLRNGLLQDLGRGSGELYCEKALIVEVDQVTPLHFHWTKTEDIINRGGGRLVLRLYNATKEGALADTPVTVRTDGIARSVAAGGTLVLTPGESITLVPYCYHTFWAVDGTVLAGEVSLVNDDEADNRFYEPLGRYPEVVEDEPPLYLTVSDYGRYGLLDL